jgi:peptidoglycan LD-endopeptidase LytH
MRLFLVVAALCGTAAAVVALFQPPRASPTLVMPVAGMRFADIRDTFNESRGGRKHEATDIVAPRGTPVLAVDDGTIVKLFWSKAGGRTIYQFDKPEKYCYYYAHLDGYAPPISEGGRVRRGQIIGYVGTTGNAPANTPHLHFGITIIGADRKWWGGVPVDPYPVLRASARKLEIKN